MLAEMTLQKMLSSAASRAIKGMPVVWLSLNTSRTMRSADGSYTMSVDAPPGNTSRRAGCGLGGGEHRADTSPDSATTAVVQNGDVAADFLHHAHLVSDDDHRDAQLLVDVPDQLQDLAAWCWGPGRWWPRRTAAPWDRWPAHGRWRRAAAGRRTAGQGRRLALSGRPTSSSSSTGALARPQPSSRRASSIGKAHVAQAGALHQQVEPLEDHGDLPPGRPQLGGGHGVQPLAVDDHLAAGEAAPAG